MILMNKYNYEIMYSINNKIFSFNPLKGLQCFFNFLALSANFWLCFESPQSYLI